MIVDNSMIAAFSKCHIYGALRYFLHRKPNSQRLASQLGTSSHAIAKRYFAGEADLYPYITEEMNTLRQVADENDVPVKWRQEALTKFQSIIANMLAAYPVRLTNNGPVILTSDKKRTRFYVRHTEISFTLPIASGRHTIIGSIDAIVENDMSQWRIWEMKTSRYTGGDTWRRQWQLSTQPLTYEYVARAHTHAHVLGTLIVPFNTNGMDCRADSIIEIEHTPQQLDKWYSDVITYLDWLSAIADECGIEFDADGRSKLPFAWTDLEICTHASRVLRNFIPTGQFAGNCSNNYYGQCDYYGICQVTYLPQFIESQTHHSIWDPRHQPSAYG